ncbi:MAG: FAD-dependent oxidoreductase [Bacteroidota bacterium]
MEKTTATIAIVGAGVSGLIAAKTLEAQGYNPIVFESSDEVGGRVRTDWEKGIAFDRGFQVLLTAYPETRKHLDFKGLQLLHFKPGALIFAKGKTHRIGDPLRDISALWPTIITSVGSLKDKLKIFSLSQALKSKSVDAIFAETETTTLTYLKNYGFSDRIIAHFFKPFFTGIFLEEALQTSSRMFEFVFKMFAEGSAAIPEKGIGAISQQLNDQLKTTQFQWATTVNQLETKKLHLDEGKTAHAHAVIATAPLAGSREQPKWKSCHNFYFEVAQQRFDTGLIGLVADSDAAINNLYYLFPKQTDGRLVLSVTVVKETGLELAALTERVSTELQQYCGITTKALLKHYHIKKALPDLQDLKMYNSERFVTDNGIWYAGDIHLNGSLNAAMLSGEEVANAVSNTLSSF